MNLEEVRAYALSVNWERYKSEGIVDLHKVAVAPELKAATGSMFEVFLGIANFIRDFQRLQRSKLQVLDAAERDELVLILRTLLEEEDVEIDTAHGRSIVRRGIQTWGIGENPLVQEISHTYSQIPAVAPRGKLAEGVRSLLDLVLSIRIVANQARLIDEWMPPAGALRN